MKSLRWPFSARAVLGLYSCLYAVAIPLWFIAVSLQSLFWKGAIRVALQRLGLAASLRTLPKNAIWLHAVSAGEVAATAVILPALRKAFARDFPIILSSTTASGIEMAQKKFPPDVRVFYSPLDSRGTVRRFFSQIEPAILAVAEIEIWPNLFREAAMRGVPLMLYNARMPDTDWKRYARFRWLFVHILSTVRVIGAQSAEDASRYCDIGAATDRMIVTGNVKNDQEFSNLDISLPDFDQRPTILLASSHPGEEKMVLEAIKDSTVRLVIAPRQIGRAGRLLANVQAEGYRALLRSQVHLQDGSLDHDIMILDSFGELMAWAARASFVIMGGSFSRRVQGHNPMEAAAVARPLILGPCMDNFRESRDALVAGGGAVLVSDTDQLASAVKRWLQAPAEAKAAGQRARVALEGLRGATARTVTIMKNISAGRKKIDSCHGRR